ncbi:hypothetical protein [Mesonia aquimarina]|uniref:hypothetical protein n=1 Tax=Mesonia aquimarina TaxID=1504967 RepID=UPI000EF6045A|nr:hypothetical protein [Mesonia aquimarina]
MKPNYKSVLFVLNENEQIKDKKVTLDSGERVFVAAVKGGTSNESVRVSIDENGSELHPPMDVKFYDGQFGNFKQRALELDHKGGSDLTVKLNASAPIANGEKAIIEVVFLTEKTASC